MRIAVVGTRGIPNQYGGFEQFAEYLSVRLVQRGHEVIVYNPDFHSYQKKEYKGVSIVHQWSPEKLSGAAANFIYDYLCLKHAIREKCDVILSLGYTSAAVSYLLLNFSNCVLLTNMDGLEWKRSKFGQRIRKFLFGQERIAVTKSDAMIADNLGLMNYIQKTYKRPSYYIPYGAEPVETFSSDCLANYHVEIDKYFMLVARIEPENNIEMILEGYKRSNSPYPMLVVGKFQTQYAQTLVAKYATTPGVRWVGGIYNYPTLCNIRKYCRMYFHGHSVGGTNPSLLEAMASQSLLAVHRNKFNLFVVGKDAFNFKSADDVSALIASDVGAETKERFIKNNLRKIDQVYSWDKIADAYENTFQQAISEKYDRQSITEVSPAW